MRLRVCVCVGCLGHKGQINKQEKKICACVPLCQCLGSIAHLAKSVRACACWERGVCVCVCAHVCRTVCARVVCFSPLPSSSQSCLYLSVMVVPCCLHSASRGSAMNCSVISVNILAPLESRIFSISLTYRRREEETGRTVTYTPARAYCSLYKQELQRAP